LEADQDKSWMTQTSHGLSLKHDWKDWSLHLATLQDTNYFIEQDKLTKKEEIQQTALV